MKYKEMTKAVEIPKSELCSTARKEVLPIKSANDDAQFDIFKTICCGDLKKKISDNVANTFKSNSVHVHITGPFCNKISGKSCWVVVYSDSGKAYMLKAQFISAYVSCLLGERKKVKSHK
jgi:hypothetical protein